MLTLLALLASGAYAASLKDSLHTTHTSRGGSSTCHSGFVNLPITANNTAFNFTLPSSQIEVTQIMVDLFSTDSTYLKSITTGHQSITGTYKIGVTLCGNGTKAQILTHGIGFDRSYWDFAPGYSYVDVAVNAGYTVLFYDRLGTGLSDKPDPINVIQSAAQVKILEALVGLLDGHITAVGHSFGSAITTGLVVLNPTAVDAVVITDFSVNVTGMPAFSLGQNLALASKHGFALNNGFLVLESIISEQQTFFHYPGFDPAILELATATRQPVTFGELLTTGVKPSTFTGPVLAVAGEEDLGFCFGNCSYPANIMAETLEVLFPNARGQTLLVPDAGHGLNLHYSARKAFKEIQEFLASVS